MIAKRLLFIIGAPVAIYALTWLLGPAAAERALLDLDRARLRAAAASWGVPSESPMPPELTVERFVALHHVTFPLLLYYEGQSYTRNGPIADTVKPSLVVWYGVSATVVWQSKEWFPGRSSRIRQLAETGY